MLYRCSRLFLLVGLTMIVMSCKNHAVPNVGRMTSDEAGVIHAAIVTLLGEDITNVTVFVMTETTLGPHAEKQYRTTAESLRKTSHMYAEDRIQRDLVRYATEGRPGLDKVLPLGFIEAVDDLIKKNMVGSRVIMPDEGRDGVALNFISGKESRDVFSNMDGWQTFKDKYTNGLLVQVSRVGFSNDKRIATLYVAEMWGPLASSGDFYVLVRYEGQWLLLPLSSFYGPSWVS